MGVLFMGVLFRNFVKNWWLLFLLACFAAGCSRSTVVVDRCGEEFEGIVKAASSNSEIKGYAGDFVSERLPMVWDGNGRGLGACPNDTIGALTNSSSRSSMRGHPYVLINRLYFDNDAAFIDLHFSPSGKNVDAFMRKRNGVWRVVEKGMWEE
jgi:hypothetical protein